MNTFYWHDYETWGANPSIDRPSQFAGVRTDEALNMLGEPLVMYCQPQEDLWPNPIASLITGITPQRAAAEGLPEREFIAKIHREFMQAGTCSVGYNTLRFDDEVTRYTLYRNFYDPYEREWRNGNSRWDVIDMVRLVYALRPQGIEWPMVDGKPSFKLENLSLANGIVHAAAHDAFSDVEATINMAKLIKLKQPSLYEYCYQHRKKNEVGKLIDLRSKKPLLHVSSRFPATQGCAGIVAPLAMHPVNKNAVIMYDLSVDPTPLMHLTAEEIRERVFVSQEELGENIQRLPLKLVHLNKCPILATTKLIDAQVEARLGLNKDLCESHWQKIRTWDLKEKLHEMYRMDNFIGDEDPETRLYDGFVGNKDKPLMEDVRRASGESLVSRNVIFDDARLNQVLERYKARNFFDLLPPQEQAQWREFVAERLFSQGENASKSTLRLGYDEYREQIQLLRSEHQGDDKKLSILDALEQHGRALENKYQVERAAIA